jgi:hypothetical protein
MLTVTSGVIILAESNYSINLSYHSISGVITLMQSPLLLVVAIWSSYLRYSPNEWRVKFVKTINDIHKYHGYAAIVCSQVTISMGFAYYLIA